MATIVGSHYYDRGMMFYLQCPNAVEEESMPLSIIELLELANAIENDCIDTYIDTSSKVLTQWINGTDSVLTLREFIQAYKEHITPCHCKKSDVPDQLFQRYGIPLYGTHTAWLDCVVMRAFICCTSMRGENLLLPSVQFIECTDHSRDILSELFILAHLGYPAAADHVISLLRFDNDRPLFITLSDLLSIDECESKIRMATMLYQKNLAKN